MKWSYINRLLDEGLEADNWRQFHLTAVKLQIHWIAFLGTSRLHFLFITIAGLPLTALCFWLAYLTDFATQDTSDWPALSVVIWYFIIIPAKLTPIVYPLHLFVSFITGAFFKEFWECVYRVRSENKADCGGLND